MRKFRATKIIALVLSALLILPVLNISVAAPNDGSVNDTYNTYFNDIYPSLTDKEHVLKSLTYHELDYLLDSEGTYVVLFGGAWDADTQAAIGYINEVAKASGIKAVHNFDPRLDGKTIDIRDNNNNPYTRRYVDLVNNYLTNLEEHIQGTEVVSYTDTVVSGRAPNQTTRVVEGSARLVETPFVFVYNKANSKPIIAALEGIDALQTDGKVDAAKASNYKDQLKSVFDKISGNVSVLNNKDYITFSYNEFSKTTIFDESDQAIVIEPVTYDELLHILDREGNYAFIFGCSWCGNTQAAIKFVNQYAKKYNIDTVYNWDTKLDGGIGGTPGVEAGSDSGNFLQTRATGHPYANLYVDLVNNYLTNIETLYDKESNNVSYIDGFGQQVVANKLQVPYVFLYNKDNKDENGNAAPILGHVELMYTWANIQPDYEKDGELGQNYNSYTEALDQLFPILHGAAPQSAPTEVGGKAPSSVTSKDGEITGLSTALEYKRADDRSYAPVTSDSITGLSIGTYYIRVAAKEGYKASPSVIIDLNLEQATPTGLSGAAPTSSANDDGRIEGTTALLEYKQTGTDKFIAATEPFTIGLAAGKYEVRTKAVYGYNPSATVEIEVPAYDGVSFTDVAATAWYNKAASVLVNKGIANDVTGTSFDPHAHISQGQLIQWALRGYQLDAAKLGFTKDQLASKQSITRQDAIALLYDVAVRAEKLPKSEKTIELSSFSDADKISSKARAAVQAFVDSGVIGGSDAKLNPNDLTTRAEAAQLLYVLLSR